ncbi:hypothetical protein HHK36_024503 [Tetracentron sinense]|uniref:Uncharacterized protein n=1 Tax=Tetracentron sinense TaxID=13715 RepID=A0A835D4B1_TETSI|nr:hypothetical protein HHK36_024503 [Tetracentron sinense]
MTKTRKFLQNLIKPFKSYSEQDRKKDEEDLENIAAQEQKLFSFETLVAVTKDFHPNNKLGEGGFGPVYKAWKLYKKGRSLEILDPTLGSGVATEQVAMCIQIGLLCTQSDPKLRPDMRRVVVMLSKKPGTLEEPTRPGYPGSRYRRSRKPTLSSSTATSSGESSSHTFASTSNTNTNTNTNTNGASSSPTFASTSRTNTNSARASASTPTSPSFHAHGKRPMRG